MDFNPGPAWTMDCLLAIGSAFTGTGTKFKVDLFHDDLAGSKVSVGVDNLGRFGIYNGGTFTVLSALGTVAFSVDNNGNGYYTDPGDTLNVYRLRIVGNYNAATPYVNLYTSDANSLNLTHRARGLSCGVNAAPASGQSAPGTVVFYKLHGSRRVGSNRRCQRPGRTATAHQPCGTRQRAAGLLRHQRLGRRYVLYHGIHQPQFTTEQLDDHGNQYV